MVNYKKTLVTAAALVAIGCGDDAGPGLLEISIYGEEYIEEEIPAAELVDGWHIVFDEFLISIGDIGAAAGHDGAIQLSDAQYRIFDLAASSAGAGYAVTSAMVDGGAYDNISYRIAAATDAVASNVEVADVTFMVDEGLAVYVRGSATLAAVTKTFAWSFTGATSYGDCHGTAVIDDSDAVSEITIHGDHFFYDDLVTESPNLAFAALAQADDDGDGDGDITAAELAGFMIATQERYQVGSLDIDNLWDYLAYLTTTLGHIDGEGHCDSIEPG